MAGEFANWLMGVPNEPKEVGDQIHSEQAAFRSAVTPGYSDPAIGYANARGAAAQLMFQHVPTGNTVSFMAFLESFSDNYDSKWNSEEVYGRMDPIQTFRGTSRTMNLSWTIPADSITSGYQNLSMVQGLVRMLYPVYTEDNGANSISKSPLIRIKFANLVAKQAGGDVSSGLLGTLSGLSVEPDLEAGFFDNPVAGTTNAASDHPGQASPTIVGVGAQAGSLAPKVINLSCEFTVLHEHELGFKKGAKPGQWDWRGADPTYFPYQQKTKANLEAYAPDPIPLAIFADDIAANEAADEAAAAEAALRAGETTEFNQEALDAVMNGEVEAADEGALGGQP
tara:strand:- start:6582 stop:7598 length:1017 start_codon:yes stop_codon:yes gene_type:complete